MRSTVAVIRCGTYDIDEVERAVRRGVELLGGIGGFARAGERVVVKPNVLYGSEPQRCVVTHPSVFRAVALMFREAGALTSYGDSPALRSPESNLKSAGFTAVADALGLTLADFRTPVSVAHPSALLCRRLVLAKGVVDADAVVSVGKCKTHGLTRFTGAVKNLYGCVPGTAKGQYHAQYPDLYDFAKLVVDICGYVRPRLSVIDAVEAMEGNGPGGGKPRHVGAIVLSADPVAADAVACRLINLPADYVPTLAFGEQAGVGVWRNEHIDLVGDPIEPLIVRDFDAVRLPPSRLPVGVFRKAVKRLIVPRPAVRGSICIRCGRCIDVCPVDPKAVAWGRAGKSAPPRFRPSRCIRCFCCNEICPAKAIVITTPVLGRLMPVLSFTSLLAQRLTRRRGRGQ